MSHTELHDAISRLEARLEELAESQANCRKMIMASRFAVGGAACGCMGMILGVFTAEAVQLTTAISVFLGGIVFFGSNTSTLEQTSASIQSLEAERAGMIEGAHLRLVSRCRRRQ